MQTWLQRTLVTRSSVLFRLISGFLVTSNDLSLEFFHVGIPQFSRLTV